MACVCNFSATKGIRDWDYTLIPLVAKKINHSIQPPYPLIFYTFADILIVN